MSASERQPHIDLQGSYFDERVQFFLKPIPASIQVRTREIVKMAGLSPTTKILDVGCGVGVLIGHFLEFGVMPRFIVGCDLSAEMLANAKDRYPQVFFLRADICDISFPLGPGFPDRECRFDRVFFNACFGNMWDQKATLEAAFALIEDKGNVILSHPLGAQFVEALRKSDPDIVPHSMPNKSILEKWKTSLDFEVDCMVDRTDFYFVKLSKKSRKAK